LGDVENAILAADVVDGDDVGVIQRGHGAKRFILDFATPLEGTE